MEAQINPKVKRKIARQFRKVVADCDQAMLLAARKHNGSRRDGGALREEVLPEDVRFIQAARYFARSFLAHFDNGRAA